MVKCDDDAVGTAVDTTLGITVAGNVETMGDSSDRTNVEVGGVAVVMDEIDVCCCCC